MRRKQQPGPNDKPPKKFKFFLGSRERYILINCDFDSGNIQFVRQLSQFQYRLASQLDGSNTNSRVNSKSWFYFCVSGFPRNTKGKFFITRVQTLSSIYYSKLVKAYKPVCRVGDDGPWERLPGDAQLVMREDGELECVFQHLFREEGEKVYFAFCYPFTYADNKKYLNSLNDFIYDDDFYFHKQVLVQSLQGRDIHLVTITSYDLQDKNQQQQLLFDENLFPERVRALKFDKPVVLISARVHPGQSSSSYAMKGVLDFLTNKSDLRAKLLRKMFVFMLVPMINVDGVYHGHFRMDTEGKNLNRYYITPSLQKHPAIYAIKQLASHLNKQNRLSFYFDLHAHNAKKGHFIYGNAINDFVEQVESQVFCKLIAMNNKGFEYEYCNFSQKHMNAKDRNEDLTKEGCGRVVMHRLAKIIHSYSVECGIVSANKVNILPDPLNVDFTLDGKGMTADRCEDNNSEIYKTRNQQNALFTPEMYENLGKNLMVSILDVFDKNPYNRVYNSKYKSMDMLRRITAFEIFHQTERFRMFERFVYGKVKNINELIRQVLNTKLHYNRLYNFYFFDDKELKNVVWPDNIPGLCKPKVESPTRIKRYRSTDSQQASEYSDAFLKALMGLDQKKPTVTQEQIDMDNQENDSKSSETEDFSEEKEKNIEELDHLNINFAETIQIDHEKAPLQSPSYVKSELSFQSHQKQSQNPIYTPQQQIKCEGETSVRLYFALTGDEPCSTSPQKRKENPSVRVRRLLRQEFTSGNFKSQNQIDLSANDRKKQSHKDFSTTGAEIKNSIYQSIKNEIKQELRRQSREKKRAHQIQSQTSGMIKIFSPIKITKQRIKSWTIKKYQNSSEKSKLQLPSLGTQMYIIATASKTSKKP